MRRNLQQSANSVAKKKIYRDITPKYDANSVTVCKQIRIYTASRAQQNIMTLIFCETTSAHELRISPTIG